MLKIFNFAYIVLSFIKNFSILINGSNEVILKVFDISIIVFITDNISSVVCNGLTPFKKGLFSFFCCSILLSSYYIFSVIDKGFANCSSSNAIRLQKKEADKRIICPAFSKNYFSRYLGVITKTSRNKLKRNTNC